MVAIKFALLATLAAAPTVFGYAKYSALIPNGDALGKKLGHTGDDGYTPFGTMFSKNGKTWAGVCKETFPGASVTVGAALGDPCCKWTSGAAQNALSEPNLKAAACDAGAPAASSAAPAASSAAPAAAATPAPAPGAQGAATPKPAAPAVAPAAVPTPAPAGPGKVLPAVIPAPAPGSGNSTTPGKAPAPTPAGSKPAGKPHKLCH